MGKIILTETTLNETMNTCIVYFSRTGNTKRLAQAIADAAKAPIYNLTSVAPSTLQTCDLLILGTPVEGASPAKETLAFIEGMPKAEDKKANPVLHLPAVRKQQNHERDGKAVVS
jgi:flavodoxin